MTRGTDLRGPPSFVLQGEILMEAISVFHPAEQTGWDFSQKNSIQRLAGIIYYILIQSCWTVSVVLWHPAAQRVRLGGVPF